MAAAFIMGWIGTGCPVRHRLNHGFVIVFVIDRKVQYFIHADSPSLACGSEAGDGYRDLKISVTNSLPGQISYCLFILHPENNCVQPLKSSTACPIVSKPPRR